MMMVTWGVYGRSRVPHAREAASASARVKRERAHAFVRKTAGGRVSCWCCCRCRCHCRCRVVVAAAAPTSRRRGARAAPPCEMPIAVALRCALRDAAARGAVSVAVAFATVNGACDKKQKRKHRRRGDGT